MANIFPYHLMGKTITKKRAEEGGVYTHPPYFKKSVIYILCKKHTFYYYLWIKIECYFFSCEV